MGEPLNETSGITHDNPGVRYGTPLVITGSHYIQFSSSMAPVRQVQNRVYSPLHALVAPLVGGDIKSYVTSHINQISLLAQDLPPEVELSHLHAWMSGVPDGWKADNRTALLRLAHSYGVGEGADVARPVSVDLSTLFNANVTRVLQMVPVSLTANQPASSIKPWVWQLDGEGTSGVQVEEEEEEDMDVSMGHVRREMRVRERERLSAAPMALTINPGEVQTMIVQFQ